MVKISDFYFFSSIEIKTSLSTSGESNSVLPIQNSPSFLSINTLKVLPIFFCLDLGIDELFPTNTENKTVSAHLFKHDISIGYNYIFDDEHFLHMLSFSVGIGGYNGFYFFSGMNTLQGFPSSVNAITNMIGYVPFKLNGQ